MIAIVFIALFGFSPFWFSCSIGGVAVVAVWEWTQFAYIKNIISRLLLSVIFACFLFGYIYLNSELFSLGSVITANIEKILVVGFVWWIVAFILVLLYPKSAVLWNKFPAIQFVFALLTIIPFFFALLALRFEHYSENIHYGLVLLLYVFLLVWSADTGAYFAGRKFGKHKLAPSVSPGKTWEGVIGGLLLVGIVSSIFIAIVPLHHYYNLSLVQFIFYSLVTVLASIIGDLTESMFKRQAGIKDSSQLIPGHGGILDRIDSLTAALPVFWTLVVF